MKTAKCLSTNKDGTACSALARPGKTVCAWHDPELSGQRKAWSGQGGRARSNQARAKKQLPADLLTMAELQAALCRALKRVEAGEMEPGPANALASLARAITAVAEVGVIEERLSELERRTAATHGRIA